MDNNPIDNFITAASGDIDQKYSKAPTVNQSVAIKALTAALDDWNYIDVLADHNEQDKLIASAIEAVDKLNLKEVSEALVRKYNYQSEANLLKQCKATFKEQDKLRSEFEKESAEHQDDYDELIAKEKKLTAELEAVKTQLLHHSHAAPVSAVDRYALNKSEATIAVIELRGSVPELDLNNLESCKDFLDFWEASRQHKAAEGVRDWVSANREKAQQAFNQIQEAELLVKEKAAGKDMSPAAIKYRRSGNESRDRAAERREQEYRETPFITSGGNTGFSTGVNA